jgi:hypothetical protein
VQKALSAAQSAARFISALNSPVTLPVAAKTQRLRGLGYMGDCTADFFGNYTDDNGRPCNPRQVVGTDIIWPRLSGLGTCVDDGTGSGTMVDDQTQQPCDPTTGLPVGSDPNAGGGGGTYQPPYTPAYPSPGAYPGVYPGTTSPYGVSPTGLVPGFGTPISQFGAGYAPLRACNTGSNLPRCIIYQMAVDEQQQFQFVFSILQQMYAQLLQIVQQLLAQLQSAQQQPYARQAEAIRRSVEQARIDTDGAQQWIRIDGHAAERRWNRYQRAETDVAKRFAGKEFRRVGARGAGQRWRAITRRHGHSQGSMSGADASHFGRNCQVIVIPAQ